MSEPETRAFADRVMTAIESVPTPTPVRAFGWSLRAGAWRDAVASLVVAWHLGTVRTSPVAPRVRARSIALVLAVASVLATGSIVAAAAVRVAVPEGDRRPPVAAPASDGSAAPIVDSPVMDDPSPDIDGLRPPPPLRPGAAETEPTADPSPAVNHDAKHSAAGPAGTTRPQSGAGDDDLDTTESHDRSEDGDGAHQGDTDRHDDASEDSGTDGAGSDDAHDSDSSDEGRD